MQFEMTTAIRLSRCREGDSLAIGRITGSGSFRKRMLEMGFTPGATVRIVKYAPLRDPLELVVRHAHIAIRIDEAQNVFAVSLAKPADREIALQEGVDG